jgi:hypothetical protein
LARSSISNWPSRRALIVLAAAVAGIELFGAAAKLPGVARIGYDNARQPYRLVRDADLDPFASFAPTAPLAVAAETIPRDATFAIVVGDEEPRIDPELVRQLFQLWLLPRAYTPRLRDADWVIVYNHASETAGVPYTREVGLGPGVNALEVAR